MNSVKSFEGVLSGHINRSVSWYLITSFLYYTLNESVISDGEFDELCKRILDNWDKIDHPHKYLLNKDSMLAGTGFDIKYYPSIVKSSAMTILKEFRG